MDPDKTRICVLYDIYGELLPPSVSEFIDLYYNNDLSLSEAAENTGISRQGVRDGIMRGTKLLEEYEEKLGLYKKYKENNSAVTKIRAELDVADLDAAVKEKIVSLLGTLSL